MNKAVVIVHDCDGIYDCYACNSFEEADKKAESIYKAEFEERGLPQDEYEDGIWRYHEYYIGDWSVTIKDLIEC